jgi:hypothetical protein
MWIHTSIDQAGQEELDGQESVCVSINLRKNMIY